MENEHPAAAHYRSLENGPKVNDSQVKTRFAELLDLMQSTHDAKGNDYASNGRPYENMRAGEAWGVDGWKYAMLRADEKLRRLKNYAQTGSLKCEGVNDTLLDIAVLSLIAYILHEEEQEVRNAGNSCKPGAIFVVGRDGVLR